MTRDGYTPDLGGLEDTDSQRKTGDRRKGEETDTAPGTVGMSAVAHEEGVVEPTVPDHVTEDEGQSRPRRP